MKLTADERDMRDEIAYREEVQREVDDRAEMEAKRAASGFSPELLSIMDAANDGRMAGVWGRSPALNPYQDHTPEHEAWETARKQILSMRLYGPSLRRMP